MKKIMLLMVCFITTTSFSQNNNNKHLLQFMSSDGHTFTIPYRMVAFYLPNLIQENKENNQQILKLPEPAYELIPVIDALKALYELQYPYFAAEDTVKTLKLQQKDPQYVRTCKKEFEKRADAITKLKRRKALSFTELENILSEKHYFTTNNSIPALRITEKYHSFLLHNLLLALTATMAFNNPKFAQRIQQETSDQQQQAINKYYFLTTKNKLNNFPPFELSINDMVSANLYFKAYDNTLTIQFPLSSLDGLAFIPKINTITTLHIRKTKLKKIEPYAFLAAKQLRELALENSPQLASISQQAFQGLTHLTTISLDNNPLLHNLTPEHFANLPHLQQVSLLGTGLSDERLQIITDYLEERGIRVQSILAINDDDN